MGKKGNKRDIPSAYDYLRIRRCVCAGHGVGDVCEELHSSLEFLDYFGGITMTRRMMVVTFGSMRECGNIWQVGDIYMG